MSEHKIRDNGRIYVAISPSQLGGYYIGDRGSGASLGNWPTKEKAIAEWERITRWDEYDN